MNNNPFSEYNEHAEEATEPKKSKKFYWIKLKEGFFEDKYIKALRVQNNGYRIITIYLSMQLKALKTDGLIQYSQLLPSYTEELALLLNEPSEAIEEALKILEHMKLIEIWDDKTVMLVARQEIIEAGNEGNSAERVRKHREKQKSLQCNANVTKM